MCVEFRKKTFRSKVMAWKSQYANEFRSFGTNETQQLGEGQLVGQMLLQRLATGATGVNKRDTGEGQRRQAYSGQRGTRTRMRSIYTTLVYVHRIPPRVLHFSAFLGC